MKTQILSCLFLTLCVTAQSQNHAIDSLDKVLQQSKNDIDKARALNAIADQYKTVDPKQLRDYAQKALELSKKIQYKIAEGNAQLNLGNAAIIQGNYAQALQYFAAAQLVFENELQSANPKDKLEINKGLAKAYGSIGIVFAEQSNYSKALQYHLKSVKIYEETGDIRKCAQVYNNIGVVYKSRSEDFKALEYFLKAHKIQLQVKDPEIGITLTNIANSYLKQNNYPKAAEYYDKAKSAIDKNQDARALGEWHNNMGLLYKAEKKPAKAIESWNASIAAFNGIGDKFGIADTYLYLGQLYLEQGNTAEALAAAQMVLKLSKELVILEQTVEAEKLLSAIYDKQKNPALALEHHRLYSAAKDSLNNAESIRKGVESEMNFEFEKREILQKKEIEKKELLLNEQTKQDRLELIFTGLVLLLLAGLGFLFYNRMQLKKTLTLQKELAEYEQKALHLQMNPHFVFNCLGSISSFIVKNGTDSAIKYLAKFSKLMRLTLEYSKLSLIPIDKEIQSLQNYLELEQLRFNHKFEFEIIKDKAIEDDVALPPLLLQPFVENAIIHGVIPNKEMGGMITVEFKIADDQLVCMISDNGIGYETSRTIKEKSVSVHQSMALDITKKRLEMIAASTAKNANVKIEELQAHNETTGTKVTLLLPIQYASKNNKI
jgi:tetratricopeptide (TPR) repeat protein